MQLILASSSKYRKILLQRLGIPFLCISPDIDESVQPNETPSKLVKRLAASKAQAVATQHTNALIIGSDQVAVLNNQIIGKPKDHANAVEQLKQASGNNVQLYTGLCLLNAKTDNIQQTVETYNVMFRQLTETQIERYLQKDKPYDCAGSLKSESLGISLLKNLQGDDPNTLIGLPLIRLVDMLIKEGIDPVLY